MKKLLAALLLLAACDGTSPTADAALLDFQSERQQGAARVVVAPDFRAETGGMTITGVAGTPCAANEIGGELRGSGATLELRLRMLSEGCLTVLDYVGYTARIGGLAPGTYDVRVTFDNRAGAAPGELGTSRVRVR